jgi:preprotein translocase subunit SecA
MYDVTDNLANEYQANGDFENFNLDLIRIMSMESPVSEQDFARMKAEDIAEKSYDEMVGVYTRRMDAIAKQAYPVIKDVFETKGNMYTNIVVPISDGIHIFQIITNLEKAYKNQGKELVKSYQKQIVLSTIDDAWKEQLREMDDLKQSVQNATYEQKDPLLIYKFESFNLFKVMITKVNKQIVSTLVKGHIPSVEPQQVHEGHERRGLDMSRMSTSKSEAPESDGQPQAPREQQVTQPIRVEKRVGRNDPCPCGSGKKFKSCHGKDLVD